MVMVRISETMAYLAVTLSKFPLDADTTLPTIRGLLRTTTTMALVDTIPQTKELGTPPMETTLEMTALTVTITMVLEDTTTKLYGY